MSAMVPSTSTSSSSSRPSLITILRTASIASSERAFSRAMSGCGSFFPAAADHQNFYDRNPTHPYIVAWDKPKVAAFRAAFPALAKRG